MRFCMLATPQTQSVQLRGGFSVGGAGVVALRVVVVLKVGAAVLVVVAAVASGASVGDVAELLSVASVTVSGVAPGRCGSSDRTHWTKVFCDCLSSTEDGVVPAGAASSNDAADPSSSTSSRQIGWQIGWQLQDIAQLKDVCGVCLVAFSLFLLVYAEATPAATRVARCKLNSQRRI